VQDVERVVELLLRALLARDELDVVDQQRIGDLELAAERSHLVGTKSLHHFLRELFALVVQNLAAPCLQTVGDGDEQVRLSQPDLPEEEEWVAAGDLALGDLLRADVGKSVALADDEVVERLAGIDPVQAPNNV
jgi:hypothetical protein